jgi:PPOX class probable F420-dependent enzyme
MKIPDPIRQVIAKAPLAHLTTLNADGAPQVTVVWVGIENDEFVIGHLARHQKVKNIKRDPRVSLFSERQDQRAGITRIRCGARECARHRRCSGSVAAAFGSALSRARRRFSARLHARHSGLYHPNHSYAIQRNRPLGLDQLMVMGTLRSARRSHAGDISLAWQ